MTTTRTLGLALLASALTLVSTPALAQTPAPLTAAEILGDWTLVVTPVDREDLDIRFEMPGGGPMILPLTVRTGTRGRLTCALDGEPSDCRMTRGRFEALLPNSSGAARMTFTLNQRRGAGFAGTAAVRVRLLPIGGQVGTVSMTRR